MSIGKKDARKLAVCYHAFASESEPVSAGFWAGMLAEIQTKTGVELFSPNMLNQYVESGKRAQKASEVGESAVQMALFADAHCDDGQGPRTDYSVSSGEMEPCE